MATVIKGRVLSFAAASALLWASSIAHAGGATVLTDGQLDGLTAGDAFTTGTANGQSSGLYTAGGVQTLAATTTGSNSPWGARPGSRAPRLFPRAPMSAVRGRRAPRRPRVVLPLEILCRITRKPPKP